MPVYLKKSVKIGAFRFNLSKSGVGMSVGVKGLRIGTGPRGHYIHAGAKGVFYRSALGSKSRTKSTDKPPNEAVPASGRTPDRNASTYVTHDGIVMSRVISGDAIEMKEETRIEAIADLNRAQEKVSLGLVFGILGAVAAFAAVNASASAFVLVLFVSAAAILVGKRIDAVRRHVVFAYDLDKVANEKFEKFVAAIDGIKNCRSIWYIDAAGDITDLTTWKRYGGAAQVVDKLPTEVTYSMPPGVKSNLTPPSIQVAGQTLYFFPDCIFVRENKKFGAVSYTELRAAAREQRFIIDDQVPADATIVDETWAFPNKSGGPDRRFKNNRLLPICLFDEIGLIGSSGLKVLLQLSKLGVAREYPKLCV